MRESHRWICNSWERGPSGWEGFEGDTPYREGVLRLGWNMSIETLLIILVIVLLLGGGGFYLRGRR
jgi:hypothetical protein